MRKRLLQISSVVLALAVILIISAMLLISSSVGENVIRRWLEGQLTAQVGLRRQAGFIQRCLRMTWRRGTAFTDVGNVWSRPQDIKLTDFRVDSGAGLRVNPPLVS